MPLAHKVMWFAIRLGAALLAWRVLMLEKYGDRGGDRRILRTADEKGRHRQVADGDRRRLIDADRLAVHEPEERQQRARRGECGRLHELTLDHEHRDGAEYQPPEDGTAAHDRQALI